MHKRKLFSCIQGAELNFILAPWSMILLITLFSTTQIRAAENRDMTLRNRIKIKKKSYMIHSQKEESDEYTLEKIEVLSKKRRNLILDIHRFLREASSSDQKSELNMRLGSLYIEDYYANLAKAQHIFEKQLAEHQKKKNPKIEPPRIDNTEAQASLEKGRMIYKDLLSRYPQHPRRDEIIYFLGVAYLDKGSVKEGMALFKQLSEQFPRSKFGNDAMIQLADHHFEQNQFSVAETYYNKLLQKKEKDFAAYATYKKAWCAYNMSKTQNALNLFKWVIEHERSDSPSSAIRIKSEALRDITLPFVDLKQLDEAVEYFKSHGDPYYRKGVETMASLYNEAADYKRSIALWEHLLHLDPNHPQNAHYDMSVIHALMLKNEGEKAVERLFARLPIYSPNSTWYELNASNTKVLKEAEEQFEETARKYAFQFHAQGQKTKNPALYEIAKKTYENYLEYFPNSADSAQIRFFLAEILFKQGQWLPSSEHYYLVFKNPQSGKLKLDSIRYSLIALNKVLNQERKKQGLSELTSGAKEKLKEEGTEFIPYSLVENRFLEISSEYLETYPKQKDAPDILYEQAYIQYLHRDFIKAYKNFWNFVNTYTLHSSAYSASHLILDILNRRKDYPKMIASCQKFLKTSALSRLDFRNDVANILRHSELKRIAQIEEKGEFKEAGDAYIEYTKGYGPQDEILFEKALYNASVNYTKSDLHLLAAETQEKFLRRFPKSTYRESILLNVAKTYEILARFEKAAAYFEQFTALYPSHAQTKNAMRLAGLYYWGSNQPAKAEAIMKKTIDTYPNDETKNHVVRDLLELYESQGNHDDQVRFYINLRAARGVSANEYVTLTLKMSEILYRKNGEIPNRFMEEALRVCQRHYKEMPLTPLGAIALAKTLFWLAKQKVHSFNRIKLTRPGPQLEASLQRKLAILKEMEKDFEYITTLGGEWGLGSLYHIALTYRQMAQDVFQAPVPNELTAEQVELYRAEVQNSIVKPFNEKSLQVAVQCLDKAQELDVLTPWTSRCYSLASEMDQGRYPKIHSFYVPPVETALVLPDPAQTKIKIGKILGHTLPIHSSHLFDSNKTNKNIVSMLSDVEETDLSIIPKPTSYVSLSDERKNTLLSALDSEKPNSPKDEPTFGYLNILRLTQPQRAISSILNAIEKDPNNIALHNLLALAHLENGQYSMAKVSWLSQLARGVSNAAILNNLGVVAVLQGKESDALNYFKQASLSETTSDAPNTKEAFSNLGLLSLKYRNGFEAKSHFEKAITLNKDGELAKVAVAVARLQNREIDAAKSDLIDLVKEYKKDPYARLSLSYILIDHEKEPELAKNLLTEFIENESLENDLTFRQALRESRGIATTQDNLPSIGP